MHLTLPPLPFLLLLLPQSDDADLWHPPTVAAAIGVKPVPKVGSARRKALPCKRKAPSSDNNSDNDNPNSSSSTRRGRPNDARNYIPEDVVALNNCVEKVLLMGQNGWAKVHAHYKKWAKKDGCLVRDIKSLESKFKSVSAYFTSNSCRLQY